MITGVLAYAVLAGNFIPAHDETFDLAEKIAKDLAAFRKYVAGVRDAAQADDALLELAEAIKSAVYDATRPGAAHLWTPA